MEDRRRFMTVFELAELARCSTDKVYDDIRRGVLPAYMVAGLIRIRLADAQAYAEPKRVPTSPAGQQSL